MVDARRGLNGTCRDSPPVHLLLSAGGGPFPAELTASDEALQIRASAPLCLAGPESRPQARFWAFLGLPRPVFLVSF